MLVLLSTVILRMPGHPLAQEDLFVASGSEAWHLEEVPCVSVCRYSGTGT